MNSDDSWKDFGDVYATLERDICRRTYDKHIRPVVIQSSKEIGDRVIEALDKFKKGMCPRSRNNQNQGRTHGHP